MSVPVTSTPQGSGSNTSWCQPEIFPFPSVCRSVSGCLWMSLSLCRMSYELTSSDATIKLSYPGIYFRHSGSTAQMGRISILRCNNGGFQSRVVDVARTQNQWSLTSSAMARLTAHQSPLEGPLWAAGQAIHSHVGACLLVPKRLMTSLPPLTPIALITCRQSRARHRIGHS